MFTLSEPLCLASVILILQNLLDTHYFKFPFTEYDFEIRKVNHCGTIPIYKYLHAP